MTYYVEVWNTETEQYDCYAGGFHCAKRANELASKLLDGGYFARVVEEVEEMEAGIR